jgi:eukaryotic-like serine/threonine-protein kinase
MTLAHDPALRRRVWIVRGTGFQPVNEARRDVARPGRLRWLGGTAEWDAFEAPSGRPLLSFEKASQPWAAVRWWLADLAEEIAAAEKDGTLPERFDLDQVWINSAGRAMLLDDKERDLPSPAENPQHLASAAPCQAAQSLLDAMSKHALDPKTVPLHAGDVLQKLATSAFDRMSFLAGNLQSLLGKPAVISVRRRAASLLLVPAVLASMYALTMIAGSLQEAPKDAQWKALHPDLPPLSQVLRLMYATDTDSGPAWAWKADGAVHHATQVHIVGHYRDRLTEVVTQSQAEHPDVPLSADERTLIRLLFASFGPLVDGQLAQADAKLKTELAKFGGEETRRMWITCLYSLLNISFAIAVLQFFSLLIFGATLGQKVFGFAVVNKNGERAGRLRMIGRWFIAWVPFTLMFARLEIAIFFHRNMGTEDIVKCSALGFVWALCIIAAIIRPAHGYHDEPVKTWLVPR